MNQININIRSLQAYRVELKKKYPEMTIAHQIQEDGIILGTSKRSIYEYSHHKKRKYIGKFPFRLHRDFFGFSRLLSRAMRIDKNNVVRNSK